MARSGRGPKVPPPEEPVLFDLPLGSPGPAEELEPRSKPQAKAPARPVARPEKAGLLPLEEPAPAAPRYPQAVPARPDPTGRREDTEPEPPRTEFPRPRERWLAGVADFLVHASVLVVAIIGCRLLGVRPELDQWPPLLLFLASFSFLYSVIPLAFWGQTLGMAWMRIVARDRDGQALTFDQTARRWLGGVIDAALLGLPLWLCFRGRSLADWMSGSITRRGDAVFDLVPEEVA